MADNETVIEAKQTQKGGFRGGLKISTCSQTLENPALLVEKWCPEADLNHRHADFQSERKRGF